MKVYCDELEARIGTFQVVAAETRDSQASLARNYTQRCVDDLRRLFNSYALSILEWCDRERPNSIDDAALSRFDRDSLDGELRSFIALINQLQGIEAYQTKLMAARSLNSLIRVVSSYTLNCYDLQAVLSGKNAPDKSKEEL